MKEAQLHTLEFLLAFDGHVHWLDQGYRLKFEIRRVEATPERPHGLRYSFTLHDPDGNRLMGFDNAHGVAAKGSRHIKRPPATGTGPGRTKDGPIPSQPPTRCWRISSGRPPAFWPHTASATTW